MTHRPPQLMEAWQKSGLTTALVCAIICWLGASSVLAQHPANGIEASGIIISEDARLVVVEPDNYPAEVGSLNRTIEAELTDNNTIFILKRDAVYWTDSRIENENFRLHLRAEEGGGHPPIIRPAVDLGQSIHPIHSTRDLILEGIFFQGMNEDAVPEETIQHVGEDAIIVVDRCWLVGTYAYHIQFHGSNNSIYLTNSFIINGGRNTNEQNGRVIETTGNVQDTVYVENNTVYNQGHAFVRNGGAILNYLYINHNTVMNVSQYTRVGEAQNVYITNNIFRNVYTIGEHESEDTRAWIEIREQPDGFDEHERNLVFSYNNCCYLDESFIPLIEMRDQFHTDSRVLKAPNISRKYMDPANALPDVIYENNIEEKIDFPDPPTVDPIYLDWTEQWMRNTGGLGGDQPVERYDHNPIFFDQWEATSSVPAPGHFTIDLLREFTYSEEYESYTAAEDGFPLGDLNWFPELKAKWEAGEVITSVEGPEEVVKEFRLVGNYPNPFNPSTKIVYELASQASVTMEVFNTLGQSVDTVELGLQASGRHEITFDASNRSLSSGVYMVRMRAGSEVETFHMTLAK